MDYKVSPGGILRGKLRVPGDKSISHRVIMLGSLAEGVTQVRGFLEGEDSLATLKAFRSMGVEIEGPHQGELSIQGVGLHGLQPAPGPLDLGNSGTSMRLLCGLLGAQRFATHLTGDASLLSRPMRRVTRPLASMGISVETTKSGTAPLLLRGGNQPKAINYELSVASAQIKSTILLAALYAEGRTCVIEPGVTRDHTERMLHGFGYPIDFSSGQVCLQGGGHLKATQLEVPADISSATFFLVGALIAPDSDLHLLGVGVNPTRTGVLDILKLMGAKIEVLAEHDISGEPVADLHVRSTALHGIRIPPELVSLAIDEFPAIFVAAACARGETVLTGAAELRVKESDRIHAMAVGLQALGITVEETPDGIRIQGKGVAGKVFTSGSVETYGDHRIAMAFTMAALCAEGEIRIRDCAHVATSFPGFLELANQAGLQCKTSL